MNIIEMTRRDFERLPYRESWGTEGICDQIIILPAQISRWQFWRYRLRAWVARLLSYKEPEDWEIIRGLHDSGYRCMDYVAVVEGEPICRLSGSSDVLHIEGIGGYGYHWLEKTKGVPRMIPVAGWSFDCLPTSGLLRLWPDKKIIYGCALSSFEIYSTDGKVANEPMGWEDHLNQSKRLLGIIEEDYPLIAHDIDVVEMEEDE